MGIARDDDDQNQAVTGDLLPERREGLAASQFRGILREEELAQHVRRRRGNLHQHQRDLVLDRLHRRARRNATVTGPMPGPGQNGNPTAGGKKRLRPFSSERNVFSSRVELFCALDMSVIPPSGTCRAHSEVIEKEMHKPCQCRCWTHKVKRHARIEVKRFGY